jgi:hypothetical protein
MHIIATFEYSIELELAISGLEQKGIKGNKILAVPLNRRTQERKIFDTINQADGLGSFDVATAMGTVFMTLGTIYGFVWKGGPILWGLGGFIFGAIIGFMLDFYVGKGKEKKGKKNAVVPEVCLIVNCEEDRVDLVEDLLWDHYPLSMGRVMKE